MALDDLEKNLYAQKSEDGNPDKISPAAFEKKPKNPEESLNQWTGQAEGEKNNGNSFISRNFEKYDRLGKWFFWIGTIITVALMGLGLFYFYQFSKGGDASVSISGPASTLIGIPFEISVDFSNDSDKLIEDAQLSLNLPEGAVSSEEPDRKIVIKSLGSLEPNTSLNLKIPVTIFGSNPDSIQRFQASVSYYPPSLGPRVRFEKTKSYDVAVREPAIKLDISAPQKVLNNENFEVKIDYKNISEIVFKDAEIEITYPKFFNFKESNPKPSASNNIWKLADLDKNSGGTITIQGNVLAIEQSFFDIRAVAKTGNNAISEKSANINIATSPLSLSIAVNNQNNYISKTDDFVRYSIRYRNNSEVGLNDVVVKAKLTGEMYEIPTLDSRGFFNSQTNTITWNAGNTPELRLLSAGAEGTIDFSIKTKQAYPIRRLADKNFTLKIDVEISSPTVPYYVSADKTISFAKLESKVSGRVAIDAKLLYRDQNSTIKNTGPIPPKVNQPTTFNVHWVITNYATDVKNIEVKSILLSGVRFTGKVTSNIDSVPTVNERTGEVTWSIASISATKGLIGSPVEAVFRVEAIPNITQVSQPMPILGVTSLKAVDDFTNIDLTASDSQLTTLLSDDPTIAPGQGTVVQ